MVIGGLQKFSLLDYPGHISAIVFTQGCNFRCHFCYNPMLVCPVSRVGGKLKYSRAEKDEKRKDHFSLYKEDDLFDFLASRTGKLEGVVITGGEPTIHLDLLEFITKIKKLGYKVKLDTNGTNPAMLKKLLAPLTRRSKGGNKADKKNNPPIPFLSGGRLVDYIAMDIKAPLEKYGEVAGLPLSKLSWRAVERSEAISVKSHSPEIASSSRGGTPRNDSFVNLEKIKKSIKIIMGANIPYEFRTTVVPGLIKPEDINKMGEMINGAEIWYLQQFKSNIKLVDESFMGQKSYNIKEMKKMAKIAGQYVKKCEIR